MDEGHSENLNNRICPKCGVNEMDTANQFGMAMCKSCGWIQSESVTADSLKSQFAVFSKWAGLSFVLLFFFFFSIQMFLWKQYTFEASYLQVRSLFYGERPKDQIELGAICNSLNKFDCSVRIFGKIVDQDPNNRKALANLAIALAKLGKFERAKPHFEAYFSLGGGGYDVVLWYGRTLAALDGEDSGVPWYYLSLAMEPSYLEAAEVLVEALAKRGQYHEALSVIGGLTGGQHTEFRDWRSRVEELWDIANQSNELKGTLEQSFPSLVGSEPMMAGQIKRGGRLKFFFIDKRFKWLTLGDGILEENLMEVPQTATNVEIKTLDGKKNGKKFVLDWVQLGPWSFKDVEVVVCKSCPPVIGASLLSQFDLSTWTRNRIEFTTLSAKKRPTKD